MNQFLVALPLLACPIGMALMMWFMTRGGHKQGSSAPVDAGEVARLRAEIAALRAQHEASLDSASPFPAERR